MSNQNNIISLLELKDVVVTEVQTEVDENRICIELPRVKSICPVCGQETDTIHDYRIQKIIDVPLYEKKSFLVYRKRRYKCTHCGKQFYETNHFVPRYSHCTNRLNQRLFEDLHSIVSQDYIAKKYSISPMRIRRLLDNFTPSLPDLPEALGIDEFKGNTNKTKYHCILTDLNTGKPIDIIHNRSEASLFVHFKKYQYSSQLNNVKVVVIDMWRPYYSVLRKVFPNAMILIDRFHMVRQAIWSLEAVRKRIQKECPKPMRVYFKRSRTVLLKRSDRLTINEHINELAIRDTIFKYVPDLKTAYDLKEEILWMFQTIHDSQTARLRLNQWIEKAKNCGLPEFKTSIRAYQNWKEPIINSFNSPYSNGSTEGCNNKIKVIKRNGYGLRNFDRFRTRILLSFA